MAEASTGLVTTEKRGRSIGASPKLALKPS